MCVSISKIRQSTVLSLEIETFIAIFSSFSLFPPGRVFPPPCRGLHRLVRDRILAGGLQRLLPKGLGVHVQGALIQEANQPG